MDYCKDKIEELLKKRRSSNEHSVEENEVNDDIDVKEYTVTKMIHSILQIVKLSNQLSDNCFYRTMLNEEANSKKVQTVGNEILEIVSNILYYSSSDTTKELYHEHNSKQFNDLHNNYPLIFSVLEDTITRAYDCFNFIGSESKNKHILDCTVNTGSSQNEKTQIESEIAGAKSNKCTNLTVLQEGIIGKEKENYDNSIYKQRIKVGNNNLGKNENLFFVEHEGNAQSMLNHMVVAKEVSDENNINKKQNIKKLENTKYVLKNYFNKIQNAWLHLTNNCALLFIPRMHVKYNALEVLNVNLQEAIAIQEKYISVKKNIMKYIEAYRKESLMLTASEIVKLVQLAIGENEELNKEKLNKVPDEYISDCSNISDCSVDIENSGIIDESFFLRLLEKLNKDINRYRYRFSDLKNPYEYEIINIIEMYQKENADVQKFLEIHAFQDITQNFNNELLLVDNEKGLNEMINFIKENCEVISLSVKINYKKSYLGFIALIYIGTKERDYLIDTFRIFEELTELNKITTDSSILKVTYDAENMLKFLQKDFSIYVVNMFDILVSVKYLNINNKSLLFLLYNYINININENEMSKKFDLLTRPLSDDIICGMRKDCHYLIYLIDYLKNDLYFNYVFTGENELKKINTKSFYVGKGEKREELVSLNTNKNRSNNVYVNFKKADYFQISESEMKKVHDIIKIVFTESNKMCLEKYEITKRYAIEVAKKQIKEIISGSYNYHDCDALIHSILVWRKKLSKKIDEAPDNILNIHNIISIVLKVPTSISALKNSIVPLSNIVMDNIEELFKIISKSSLKMKSSRFYEHVVKHREFFDKKKGEEQLIDLLLQNKKEMHYTDRADKMANVFDLNRCSGFIVSSNLHWENSCEGKGNVMENDEDEILSKHFISRVDEKNFFDENEKNEHSTKTDNALEKILFIDDMQSNGKIPKYNSREEKSCIQRNTSVGSHITEAAKTYAKLLSALSIKVKRKKTKQEKCTSINIKENKNISAIKTIDKNQKNEHMKERRRRRNMRTSYAKQYKISNLKSGLSKNILDEIG